jgi:tRNA-binding EMAP/Myf-like protein
MPPTATNIIATEHTALAWQQEIEGKQALFVVNLPPRKMAGSVSEAMLFDI